VNGDFSFFIQLGEDEKKKRLTMGVASRLRGYTHN